ncbi:MAG: DoxX family protein, partial [Chitinophagaceae bacterium]|nr:DoxX family protein [Chitinophagaceae bacterium]
SDAEKATELYHTVTILKCDATVMKTVARVVPTYLLMQQANIIDKLSYTHEKQILQRINTLK